MNGKFTTRAAVCAVIAASLVLVSACGGSRTTPIPAQSEEASAPDQDDYRIGPGDTLDIFVWRNPEVSTTVPVRPDGKISTPLVENMVAAGKTPSELSEDIEEVLAEYIRTPQVNVIVQDFVGTFGDQIRVVGEAANPQSLPYRDGMTLLDVMIAVGGLGEFAAGNRAKVIRQENGQLTEIRVKLHDLLNRGKVKHNIEMRPGDVVTIPETLF